MAVSLVQAADGIGYIRLNRPPANAYDDRLLREFDSILTEVRNDPRLTCLILQSELARNFCAGADIEFLKTHFDNPDAVEELRVLTHHVTVTMEDMPKIFIAAIAGHAIGGGLELALACDFRFAAEGSYKLGLAEISLGLFPGGGGTQRLARLIGRSKALDLVITGTLIGPADAARLGIVDRLVPADALEREVEAYARKLAAGPAQAIGAAKLTMYQGLDAPLRVGLAIERFNHRRISATEDARIGLKAFLEKQPPRFSGR